MNKGPTTTGGGLPIPTRTWAPESSLADWIGENLHGVAHCCLVSNVPEDDDELLRLARHIGNPIEAIKVSAARPNPFLYDVRSREQPATDAGGHEIISTTRQAFELHSDGYSNLLAPKYVCLYCKEPARLGGETLLLPASALFSDLSSACRIALADPVYPSSRGRRRIVLSLSERLLQFNDYEIRNAWTDSHTMSAVHIAALEGLRSGIASCGAMLKFGLRRGDYLILDNRRYLHGRAPFADASRHLIRVWVE